MKGGTKKRILGVDIDDVSMEESLRIVEGWVREVDASPKIIATVGPNFLVRAHESKEFLTLLKEFDLNLPEGVGLQLYGGCTNRVPGVDFVLKLCLEASRRNWAVGLLGSIEGVGKKAAERLTRMNPGMRIVWAIDGDGATEILNRPEKLRGLEKVDLLFVAFGNPKQEFFLKKAQQMAPRSFGVGVGIGGTLDYISGAKSPLPRALAPVGLEWLGRLIVNPRHIGRIWRSTIVFPWLLFWNRRS